MLKRIEGLLIDELPVEGDEIICEVYARLGETSGLREALEEWWRVYSAAKREAEERAEREGSDIDYSWMFLSDESEIYLDDFDKKRRILVEVSEDDGVISLEKDQIELLADEIAPDTWSPDKKDEDSDFGPKPPWK